MKVKYKHVMSPIRVGNHILKNRIIAAPVTLHSASNGEIYPTESAMNFFVQRAKEGAGLVVCAGVKVLPVVDDGEHANWSIYKHNAMNRLAELAERIHFYGAKASMELIGIFDDGYVASEGGLLMDGITPGREIPISEMMRYKEGYVHSAEMLMKLGYDGILLHFGHSIPIAQFLSPLTNKRTDQYGGSFENRVRYIVEILQAIREKVGNNMIIEIRMSADEFKKGGIDLEEGIKIAEVLQEYADIIQASCGMVTPDLMCRTHPCDFLPPNPNVYLAEAFKKSGRIKSYVTAIGAIGSLEDADEIIASGKADFVAICRALIADPKLITKSISGKEEDVVPCIKCMRCHDSTVYGHFFQCSVNPTIGIMQHLDSMIVPVTEKKKVAVIGGGPAGMYAALTASKRGHEVTLYEKTDSLGGALKFATKVDFKYSLAKFRDYLINQVKKSQIKVKLNNSVLPDDIKNEGYDAVIVAVGAKPLIPPIPGVEHSIFAINTYGIEDTLGDNVVIIGGGQVGCETGLHLARLGKTVTILEMCSEMAKDASKTHRDDILSEMNKEPNLIQITSAKCTEIHEGGVLYKKGNETFKLSADSVVLAAGMKPCTSEADAFMGTAPVYWVAGDCVKARTVETAIREGYFAGINI
ncbi:FAD-dependent oxidoreductase [Caloramator sp. E03]|uniref:FAD-dependent oxidoreductase n=1 Tax=Caloramator sp. E03 TaxID=2576307 RepID=UPI001110BDDF|nr:FAD-dependent oxidoreductase [Caloramator sp. E03]QCX33891.1 FAD-dependent oxidoreductase [Caloramator sp. E03]